jgi:hypothetical protein
MVSALPVSSSAPNAPPMDIGNATSSDSGCTAWLKRIARIAYTQKTPVSIATMKLEKSSCWRSASPLGLRTTPSGSDWSVLAPSTSFSTVPSGCPSSEMSMLTLRIRS